MRHHLTRLAVGGSALALAGLAVFGPVVASKQGWNGPDSVATQGWNGPDSVATQGWNGPD